LGVEQKAEIHMSDLFLATASRGICDQSGSQIERDTSQRARMLKSLRIPPRPMPQAQQILHRWSRSHLFPHVADLNLSPYSGERSFRFDAYGYHLGDTIYVNQYCDAVSGLTGAGRDRGSVVAHFVLSGSIGFESGAHSVTVRPGQMCVRDIGNQRFWVGPGTVTRWMMVPRPLVVSQLRHEKILSPTVVSNSSPEAKFLIAYLEAVKAQDHKLLTYAGTRAIEQAAVTLLSGVIAGISRQDARELQNATLQAARRFIDLKVADQELTPASIAHGIGVSLRTLHRSFAAVDESVMGYLRGRRLQEAHAELLRSGGAVKVAELAAKWKFSDSSHFIRQFKEAYGTTPAAYLRNL
jgi:AraC-like DNA-binding protein